MTVTATSYTPITHNGNGSTTVFNVTFQFYEIAVIHIDSSGSETEWTENTHYTVTGGEGSTGSITATPTVPATGEKLRIERRTSKDQPRDYDLDNAVLEAALQQSDDRLAMILQELDYDNRRRPAISKANYTAEVEFPTASTGSVLSWAADGNLANTALVDLDGVAISALTTTTSLEDTDLLPLYDNSAGDNAAITWANVKTAVSTALNLGALAVLDELPDNSVTAAKLQSGLVLPVGSFLSWSTDTVPDGFLVRDGSAVSRATYADLFAVIGTRYGAGDGSTTFNLPDHRGLFERFWDDGSGVDADASSRTDRGDGTTGDAVGTIQSDAIRNITGGIDSINQSGLRDAVYSGAFANNGSANRYGSAYSGGSKFDFDASRVVPVGSDNRPKNFSSMPIIKY